MPRRSKNDPPFPQDPETRAFPVGTRVRSLYRVHACPAGDNEHPEIAAGALGTVDAELVREDDPIFPGVRLDMLPVRWDAGFACKLSTRLVRIEREAPEAVTEQQWYRCRACGGAVVVFVDPADGLRKIGHEKPAELLGTRGKVPCEAYRRCTTFEFFEREMKGEPIEGISDFRPVS